MKSLAAACVFAGATFTDMPASATPINVLSPGAGYAPAVADAVWGVIGCTVATTGTAFCPISSFTNKTGTVVQGVTYESLFIADDSASSNNATSGKRIPYAGTIESVATVTGGINLTLSPAPVFANAGTVANHVAEASVVSGEGGAGYAFGSTQTLVCSSPTCTPGDGHNDGTFTPSVMTPIGSSFTQTTLGNSGSINAVCTLESSTQVGLAGAITTIVGTIGPAGTFTMTSIAALGTITRDYGPYSAGYYTERFTNPNCGYGSTNGPKFSFEYTVLAEAMTPNTGIYQSTPPCASSSGTATGPSGVASGLTLTCLGATFAGTSAIGTDNTQPLQNLLAVANADSAIGSPQCLYAPGGDYLVKPLNQYSGSTNPASGTNVSTGYGCWLGDEHYHTNFFLVPDFQGDLFAVVDSNSNNSLVELGNTQTFQSFGGSTTADTANQGGSAFRNFTILGDRLSYESSTSGGSSAPQNGIAYYGPTQFAYIDNIVIDFLLGHAFYAGAADAGSAASGDFNESVIQNVRFEDDGNGTLAPTFEITSTGGADASNTDSISNVRIFQSFGKGLWIHNLSVRPITS